MSRVHLVLILWPVLFLANCDEDDDAVGGVETAVAGAAVEIQWEPVPGSPGSFRVLFPHDGKMRGVLVDLPPATTSAGPRRVLFAFHGHGGSASTFRSRHPRLRKLARENNFILCIPQGGMMGDGKRGWYTYDKPEIDPPAYYKDDRGFIVQFLAHLVETVPIDTSRVFASGTSQGGRFTHFLLASEPFVFAAGVPVATSVAIANEVSTTEFMTWIRTPLAPVSIMMINGGEDQVVRWEGGIGSDSRVRASVQESIEFWLEANQCDPEPIVYKFRAGDIVARRYVGGDGNTEVISLGARRMRHGWPESEEDGIDASSAVIKFFLEQG